MREFGYVPGSVPTAIGRSGVAMVQTKDHSVVVAIHRQARSIYDALDMLTETGLPVLPDFVFAQVGESAVSILVRGGFVVTVEDIDGRTITDGSEAGSWAEIRVPLDSDPHIAVGVAGTRRASTLPMNAGVVLADHVVVHEGGRAFGPDDEESDENATLKDVDPTSIQDDEFDAMPEPESELDVESAPVSEVEAESDSEPELEPRGESEPDQEPEPEPAEEPEAEVEPESEESEPDAEPEARPSESIGNETRFDIEDDRFSAAFGLTIQGRRPEDAAVRESIDDSSRVGRVGPPPGVIKPPPPQPVAAPPVSPSAPTPPSVAETVVPHDSPLGDHDGQTMTPAQLAELRRQGSKFGTPAVRSQTERPRVTLSLPTGEVVVEGTVILGRRPQARQASSTDVPRLITIDNPYVSGTHLEIRFEGDEPRAVDVSRNGTLISYPGRPSQALVPGTPTPLVDGCQLELTDGLVIAVRIGH